MELFVKTIAYDLSKSPRELLRDALAGIKWAGTMRGFGSFRFQTGEPETLLPGAAGYMVLDEFKNTRYPLTGSRMSVKKRWESRQYVKENYPVPQ